MSADDAEFTRDLAFAMAAVLEQSNFIAPTIGFTSWSRTLRLMVGNLKPLRAKTTRVVEMLVDQRTSQRVLRGADRQVVDRLESLLLFAV